LKEANQLIADSVAQELPGYDKQKLGEAHALISSLLGKKNLLSSRKIAIIISLLTALATICLVIVGWVQLSALSKQQKQNVTIEAASAITQKKFSDTLTKVSTAARYIKNKKHKNLEDILKSYYGRDLLAENTEALVLDIYFLERYFHNLIDLAIAKAIEDELVYIIAYRPAKDFISIYSDCWEYLGLARPDKNEFIVVLKDFLSKWRGKYGKSHPYVEKWEGYAK